METFTFLKLRFNTILIRQEIKMRAEIVTILSAVVLRTFKQLEVKCEHCVLVCFSWHGSAVLSDTKFLIHGGYNGNNALSDAFVFDIGEQRFGF